MKKHRKSAKKDLLLIVSLMTVVGLALIVSGILLTIRDIRFQQRAEKVIGIVAEQHWDSSDSRYRNRTTTFVSYELDGKEYRFVRLRENVDESKGEPIQLYVDRDDPTNITTSTTPIAGILLIFMGATFLLMSLPTLIRTIRKTGMSKRLLEQGIVISVPVYGIERDPSLAVNGKQPYRVRCGYVDASTGKRYTFISNSVWDPIGDLLNPGDLVKVYVQANDYTKYHVDLEGLGNAPTVMDFT